MVFEKKIVIYLLAILLSISIHAGGVKSYPNPENCKENEEMIRGFCIPVRPPINECSGNHAMINGECRPLSVKCTGNKKWVRGVCRVVNE